MSELRELRPLEEENTRLKRVVVDLMLDKHILQEAPKKSFKSRLDAKSWRWMHERF